MTKAHSRLSSLASVLACATLATGCFTPANYGAGAGEEHGTAEKAEPAAEPQADGEKIVEGIIPGSVAQKLVIKGPEIPYEPPFDGEPLSSKTLDNGTVIEHATLRVSGYKDGVPFSTMPRHTTTWAFRSREALARSSGRISSMLAPVVPMKLAITPPSAMMAVFNSGVPAREPWM